jgi:hypothetical protein
MRRSAVILASLFVVFFTSGCFWPLIAEMAMDPMGRTAAFELAQRKYTNAVRWGDIEEAVQLVHPDLREEFLSYEGKFAGIRVTDFEVGEMVYGEGQETATVRVTYHAYSLASMHEKKIKEVQRWERLSVKNDWVVRPQLAALVEQVTDLR